MDDKLKAALRNINQAFEEIFDVLNDLFKNLFYTYNNPTFIPRYHYPSYYKNDQKEARGLPYQRHIFPR